MMKIFEVNKNGLEIATCGSLESAISIAKANDADVIDADTGEVHFSALKFDQNVKNLLSREVISQLDGSIKPIVQELAFNNDNKIDWESLYTTIMIFMPELSQYEGYKRENMEAF